MCTDIQADVEDGQLQYFYVLAFVLQGDEEAQTFLLLPPCQTSDQPFAHAEVFVGVCVCVRACLRG